MSRSYFEATARQRLAAILDAASFKEFVPPQARVVSPHLTMLELPVAFDDGVIVGSGKLGGKPVLAASEEGGFMGGAVGEVHGAKLVGLLERSLIERPAAVLLLVESGGVRLHEANAGLIAVSEVMRAVLAVRNGGIPVLALIGGRFGCFGGMGIVVRCCDCVIMSEEGRLGMSGPEVIETANGVEEFDSRDRALVWRTLGGKHRYLLGDCECLVEDDMAAFREAALGELKKVRAFSLEQVEQEHLQLARRLKDYGDCRDALDIWRKLGFAKPEQIPMMEIKELVRRPKS
jgi:malonate decarboxylase beta subunit